MSTKKSFKNTGAEAVNKFFSEDTLTLKDAHTQPDAQQVQDELNTPITQVSNVNMKTRVQSRPRINMAFDEPLLFYIQIMARLDGGSITSYVNNLIRQDKLARAEEYQKAIDLFSSSIKV